MAGRVVVGAVLVVWGLALVTVQPLTASTRPTNSLRINSLPISTSADSVLARTPTLAQRCNCSERRGRPGTSCTAQRSPSCMATRQQQPRSESEFPADLARYQTPLMLDCQRSYGNQIRA